MMAGCSSAGKSCERTAAMSLAAWHHDRQSRMGVFCVSRAQSIRVLLKERERTDEEQRLSEEQTQVYSHGKSSGRGERERVTVKCK